MSAADNINRSLDEMIKASRKDKPKKKVNKNGTPTKAVATEAPGSANSKKSKKNKKSKSNTEAKVVQAAAVSKVGRDAKANQKRGLNASGTTAKKDITKVISQLAKAAINKQKKGVNVAGGKSAPVGLKISFNATELDRSTDKVILKQVKAALSKSGKSQAPKPVKIIQPGQAQAPAPVLPKKNRKIVIKK